MHRLNGLLVALALTPAAGLGADDPTPIYEKGRKQIDAGVDAVNREADAEIAATLKPIDSSILKLDKNSGSWKVTKPGNNGLNKPGATVLTFGKDGKIRQSVGSGIKDRSAPRFASQMAIAGKLLRQAQAFQYEITESWGRAEDIEKFNRGDCADKSMWLAAKLAEAGFESVKVVLGKKPEELVGHAWVEVEIDGAPHILETTSNEPPLPRSSAGTRYDSNYPTTHIFDRKSGFSLVPPSKSAKR